MSSSYIQITEFIEKSSNKMNDWKSLTEINKLSLAHWWIEEQMKKVVFDVILNWCQSVCQCPD